VQFDHPGPADRGPGAAALGADDDAGAVGPEQVAGSVVVLVIAISGAPGSTSRMAASSAEAWTTSIRSTASAGSAPKCCSSSS
jgi:hypothetical protein